MSRERDSRFERIIFFDMDSVLVDFQSGLDKVPQEIKAQYDDDGTGKPRYDDIPGLFSLMDPMPGAIEAVKELADCGRYELYILSTAPWGNPSAWTDKLEWVKKHLDSDRPDGIFYKKLILTHHKNLCIQRSAWLIDDRKAHGSEHFEHHLIHFGTERFPDWDSGVKFFLSGEPNSVMRMTRKKGWSLLVEMKKVKKM
jgi:5'(3')-deoxyribonucleotidase